MDGVIHSLAALWIPTSAMRFGPVQAVSTRYGA
jgi:hypothetical protein